MGAYMKFRYGGWIESIPEITECGTYAINPLSEAENNCFKIASPNSTSQYYVLEYRRAEGVFEGALPGSGLLVYRIDNSLNGNGNAQGPPDEVYLYRPNGTTNVNGNLSQAHYGADYGRTEINDNTNPSPFLQNGQAGGLSIGNISYVDDVMTFDVFFEKEPVAEFSTSETLITPGCGIDFYDESLCEVDSWEWTFEGGTPSSSTDQHPQGIAWNAPGTYTVSLTASNSWGTDSMIKTGLIEVSAEALPEVQFFASDSVFCTGQVLMIEDYSSVCPLTWHWEITPGTFQFVNGTSENSQHIEVMLDEDGSYSVSLTVTNDNGEATLEKTAYLTAGGAALPFAEDFETGDPTDRGWEILNPDNGITWEIFNAGGNGGEKSAGINLFNYFQILKRDRLISPPINLSSVNEAYLSFEHAYAQSENTQYSDSLIVKISTDCGNSWTRILELGEDGSYNFATHEPYGYNFMPAVADDWCGGSDNAACNTVNISQWAGQPDTRIMFESVRLTGNNLFVDNVVVSVTTAADEQRSIKNPPIRIHPNPANGPVTVHLAPENPFTTLSVRNAMGERILDVIITEGQQSVALDMKGLPGGIYFISLEGKGERVVDKLVLR
jgi:PKD repeat protein